MIRQLSLYDVVPICEMLIDLREESPEYQHVIEDWDHVPKYLKELICHPSFVGVMDDDYRGFMMGYVQEHWYSRRLDAQEQLLYVCPQHRGTLLAPRLIKSFEKEAKAKGALNVYAGATTGMAEERTIQLYERLGYRRTLPGVRKEL
ncbi:acyltransferase [Rhizobium phage Paso]|uniref:Acyltransferase n=1 Tax=Rhizobium phage Paso TaxID=2767574 RepID=A0A7L8G504_9CAUD|nr:acyltransferase [Rhizobium phage Paso]